MYNNNNARLEVALQPFPFLSIMLFTQVVYLKLVDKATLKQQLAESEKKYLAEKEVSKLKDEFVSVVSHELRTPLTSMNLYTSLLLSGKFGKPNKGQKEALAVIKNETSHLSNLINDILTLSRFEAKHEKLNPTDYDLTELIKESSYYNLADEKYIKIVRKIPPVFLVRVDIDKFKQVFINLLSNAIKFTPAGGKITISLTELETKWSMSIADTGIGIRNEDIGKLFDKFYQGESYMTKTEKGTGLGLAIAKNIVELHHGEINVSSELGKGSVFSVIIPKDL
jgi:signal transduction histidine kinase